MEQKTANKRIIKLLLGMAIALSVIYIFKSGYKAGSWLHEITHK